MTLKYRVYIRTPGGLWKAIAGPTYGVSDLVDLRWVSRIPVSNRLSHDAEDWDHRVVENHYPGLVTQSVVYGPAMWVLPGGC